MDIEPFFAYAAGRKLIIPFQAATNWDGKGEPP